MAANNKDVIYIDIDDEITGIIDKVRGAGGKIVALVLPKRASVFQSVVNMKLLKQSADQAKRQVVLITSEAGLLPLAGSVGLYVAKTLQSKPEIPAGPGASAADEILDDPEEAEAAEVTAATAGDRPVGELASPVAAAAGAGAAGDAIETLELDDEPEASAAAAPAAAKKAKKGGKKFSIPNFDKFRLWLVLGGVGVVLLIVFIYLAVAVLPKATITIDTNAVDVNSSQTISLDTTAASLDPDQKILPAKAVTEQKAYTQQAPATGQQNKGNKATGSVAMTATKCSGNPFVSPSPVPAGTGISTSGLTYITQQDASFSGTGTDGNGCYTYSGGSVDITAQGNGAKYNAGQSTGFSVAGRSDVSASGSASGGTDNIVKVVQQADIDGAKQKISTQDTSLIKNDLSKQLGQLNQFAITATLNAGTPIVTTTANAGDTADNVTVTETITYTMFGAKEKDLKTLVDDDVKGQIDSSKQTILSEGLDKAVFKVLSSGDKADQVTLQTTATAGPDLKLDTLKTQAMGKKSADIKALVKDTPGVNGVDVHFSPFWVSSAPKKTSKITVVLKKAAQTSQNAH